MVLTLMSFSITGEKYPLEKIWIYEGFVDGISVYVTVDNENNKPGMEFKEKGVVIIKKDNSGLCATESDPIKITGNWLQKNDSIIRLEYEYRGEKIIVTQQIIELTNDRLLLKKLSQN